MLPVKIQTVNRTPDEPFALSWISSSHQQKNVVLSVC